VINRRELSSEDALTLVRRDEDHFFDHKALQIGGAKIQKIAVAFANADGGEILVGIADSSDEPDPQKRWQGSGKIEQFNFALQALNARRRAVFSVLRNRASRINGPAILRTSSARCRVDRPLSLR
jgi:hypothetical protein